MDQLPLGNEELQNLIDKIEQGNAPAFMTLYDATSRLAFGLILRIVDDRTLAEETLLDVYTQIWKKSATRDAAMSPMEWLLTFTHRSALTRLHLSKRDARKPEKLPASPESEMSVAPQQQKEARALLVSMAPIQRELLEWAYYGGLSCSEMAAQTGKPAGAVKAHLRSALVALQDTKKQESTMTAGAQDGGKR